MRKRDLACSAAMEGVLSNVPDDAEITSVAVFVGLKGGDVYVGSHLEDRPENVAAMINAFGEAKKSAMESIIKEHGMGAMVTVMFFLASNHPGSKELESGPADILKKFSLPGKKQH